MQDELDQLGKGTVTEDKLPVFLKVLCILTFVGSGLAILSSFFGLIFSSYSEDSFRLLESMPKNGVMDFDFTNMMKWQKYSNLANLLGSVLCLTGALLMWSRRKLGYFVYIPGAIIPGIIGVIAIGNMMSGALSGFAKIGGYANIFFGIAFIVMYGVNYKALNK